MKPNQCGFEMYLVINSAPIRLLMFRTSDRQWRGRRIRVPLPFILTEIFHGFLWLHYMNTGKMA